MTDTAIADASWQIRLRYRLDDFRATAVFGAGQACSLKLRPRSGHFDRASAPHTYALIDTRARSLQSSTIWLGDHDTGPEILCVLSKRDGQSVLRVGVATLLLEILQAASAGITAGDALDEHLDLLLRGFDEEGGYFERRVMRLAPLAHPVSGATIAQAFAALGMRFVESRKTLQRGT